MRTLTVILLSLTLVPSVADAKKHKKKHAPAATAAPAEPAAEPSAGPAAEPAAAPAAAPAAEAASAGVPPLPPDPGPKTESIDAAPASDGGSTPVAEVEGTAQGPAPAWTIALAPRVGGAIPTSKLGPFVSAGLEVDYFLPVLEHRLLVAVDGGYSRPGTQRTVTDARIGGEQKFNLYTHQIEVAVEAIYRFFGNEETLVPYVGLGPVMLMQQSVESARFIVGKQKEQSTDFGLLLKGGADYRLGPGFLLGELRARYATLHHRLTGKSNAGSIDLVVGYRMGLGF